VQRRRRGGGGNRRRWDWLQLYSAWAGLSMRHGVTRAQVQAARCRWSGSAGSVGINHNHPAAKYCAKYHHVHMRVHVPPHTTLFSKPLVWHASGHLCAL
jgi:hypothetical protein